jgi:hypothetical protein
MLKNQDTGLILLCELHNAMAYLVRGVFIQGADLCPQMNVVLFALCDDACLASISCYSSQLSLPKAV